MKQAGIDFRVCGQGVINRKIDMATINPDIQIDQWAMTTITNLPLRGYVRVAMISPSRIRKSSMMESRKIRIAFDSRLPVPGSPVPSPNYLYR